MAIFIENVLWTNSVFLNTAEKILGEFVGLNSVESSRAMIVVVALSKKMFSNSYFYIFLSYFLIVCRQRAKNL
jgi:hypothetical protein